MSDDAAQGDPVSWLVIRPGWKVVSVDGDEVGTVDEIAGDDKEDVFDGLAVAASALGKPRYVLSEQVGPITEGTVQLKIGRAEFEQLGEYLDPATSAVIEADDKGGLGETVRADLREVEAKVVAPTHKHEHPMGLGERIALFFKRRER